MTDRQTKILEIVNQKKKVEVVTLSQMLEVSQVTIRKDLDALEELNFLTREHGDNEEYVRHQQSYGFLL